MRSHADANLGKLVLTTELMLTMVLVHGPAGRVSEGGDNQCKF
jgi:hypothetical protein